MCESEIEKWDEAPVDVRSRLVELLENDDLIGALRLLTQFRGTPIHDLYNPTEDEMPALIAARDSIIRLLNAINYTPPRPCPFCGKLLRHPLAQQCLECRTDWHGKTPPDKRW